MDILIPTEYPKLQAADPTRPSLADLPLDIVLEIIDVLFKPEQFIVIDILDSADSEPAHHDTQARPSCQAEFSRKTNIVLRPPPLTTTVAACRLFRFAYAKSRPTLWGAHLRRGHNDRAADYHVDLARDIFYLRIHRDVSELEWNGANMPQPDPFAGALAGIQRMASSINYLTMGDLFYLMHLNPQARELNVLMPVPGLEGGGNDSGGTLPAGLRLAPVLTPLKADDVVTSRRGTRPTRWLMFKSTLVMWLRERGGVPLILRSAEESEVLARTWQLCAAPQVKGYLVDERRLDDPDA